MLTEIARCVVPVLRLGHELACVKRVLSVADVAWHTAEQQNWTNLLHWRTGEGDTQHFVYDPKSLLMTAKAELFLLFPSQVQKAEVMDFLPSSPNECPWIRDRAFELFSLTEPLGVLLAKVAWALGEFLAVFVVFHLTCYVMLQPWV